MNFPSVFENLSWILFFCLIFYIYYNNIQSVDEILRLRHNPNLRELDLRLNPVTKSDPNYRLFTIHVLPNLQKLDEREIRESERRAAKESFDGLEIEMPISIIDKLKNMSDDDNNDGGDDDSSKERIGTDSQMERGLDRENRTSFSRSSQLRQHRKARTTSTDQTPPIISTSNGKKYFDKKLATSFDGTIIRTSKMPEKMEENTQILDVSSKLQEALQEIQNLKQEITEKNNSTNGEMSKLRFENQDLEHQLQKLTLENLYLKRQLSDKEDILRADTRLRDAVDMLQESHRIITQTNERLGKELEQCKINEQANVSLWQRNLELLKNYTKK